MFVVHLQILDPGDYGKIRKGGVTFPTNVDKNDLVILVAGGSLQAF